jgi:ligand-binding SRPBCC domain-containing protein
MEVKKAISQNRQTRLGKVALIHCKSWKKSFTTSHCAQDDSFTDAIGVIPFELATWIGLGSEAE